jgi:hypothetical protein
VRLARDEGRLRARLVTLGASGLALVTATAASTRQEWSEYSVRRHKRGTKAWSVPERLGPQGYNLRLAAGGNGTTALAWMTPEGEPALFALHGGSDQWRALPPPRHAVVPAFLELAIDTQDTITLVTGTLPGSGGPTSMRWAQINAAPNSAWKAGELKDPRKPVIPADHRPLAGLAVEAGKSDLAVFAVVRSMTQTGEFEYSDGLDLLVFRKRGSAPFETLPIIVDDAGMERHGLRRLAMRGVQGQGSYPPGRNLVPFASPAVLDDGSVAVGWLSPPSHDDTTRKEHWHTPWLYLYRGGWRAKAFVHPPDPNSPEARSSQYSEMLAGQMIADGNGAQMVWFDVGLRLARPGSNGSVIFDTVATIKSYQGTPMIVKNRHGAAAAAWTDATGIRASHRNGSATAWSPARVLVPSGLAPQGGLPGAVERSYLVDLALGDDGTLYVAYERRRKSGTDLCVGAVTLL